jgi:hypothetical protein
MAKAPRLKRGDIWVTKDPNSGETPYKVIDASQHYIRLLSVLQPDEPQAHYTYYVRDDLKEFFRPVKDEDELGFRILAIGE